MVVGVVSLRNVKDRRGKEFWVVSGGRFQIVSFRSKSRALEVAAQRRKYLAFMQGRDRDKLFKQKQR
jgi:hypothetical protein